MGALRDELITDPLGRGYAGMTDEEAATRLNIKDRKRNRTTMTGSEVLNAVNIAEWPTLSEAEKRVVWDVVHLGEINPFGIEAALLTNVFGVGSGTITALAASRKEDVSRAVELGLSRVRSGTVAQARAS